LIAKSEADICKILQIALKSGRSEDQTRMAAALCVSSGLIEPMSAGLRSLEGPDAQILTEQTPPSV
jgi:hypothetical protein